MMIYSALCMVITWQSAYVFFFISGIDLHELLEGSDIHLPEPVVPPRVSAVLFCSWFVL